MTEGPGLTSEEEALVHDLPERFNLRDLGGLRTAGGGAVAWRRLYRGAGLNELDAAELPGFQRLGIATAVDLRTAAEFENPAFPPWRWARNLPMLERLPDMSGAAEDAGGAMAALYVAMLEQGAEAVAAVLEILAARESYPVVIYCAAGKDRTGVMMAVILGLLGVSDRDIAADYARSGAAVQALLRWLEENDPDRYPEVPASTYLAPEATMLSFLGQVAERHGSIAGYLDEIGVPTTVRAAVARNLLTEPG